MTSLYELTGQYSQLASRLADMDMDATTVADTIESTGLVDDIAQKATGIEMVARGFEMHIPAIDGEIARLQALKSSRVKKAQGLRDYLLHNMQAAGISKIESPLFNIRLQDNPPSVDIYEPGLVPSEYMKTPPTPPPAEDKVAIAKAIKAGHEIPGCKLTQTLRLVVK